MERKGRIRSQILNVLAAFSWLAAGCSHEYTPDETEVSVNFSCGSLLARAMTPDEDKISDISLLLFDGNGEAEECLWLPDGAGECRLKLLRGKKYILCACANFGYQVYADATIELDEIRYHLAYPDDYRLGIPMFARMEFVAGENGGNITVELERLMAKVSLRMDRRKLSKGVEVYVRSVRIGNCPRMTSLTSANKVSDRDGCFPAGFFLSESESAALNETSASGLSKPVSLYMLENMQGSLDAPITEDSGKTFGENDHRRAVCSYVEIELDYMSDLYQSGSNGLIYRFYLGEGRNDLNVERNCHYHITVVPEDDGLSDDGWRVDKSGLVYCGPTSLTGYPSDYIVGDIGDKIHIWCDITPENAPFDVGEDYMKDDKAEGIYDYVIDEDGHGATLTLTGPGRGLIYMEAGPPVNDAALFIIEVNLPKVY